MSHDRPLADPKICALTTIGQFIYHALAWCLFYSQNGENLLYFYISKTGQFLQTSSDLALIKHQALLTIQTKLVFFLLFGREDSGEVPAVEQIAWQEEGNFEVLKRHIQFYIITKSMRAQLWVIVTINPRKNRASSELLYKSNRPQVSMVYRLINHLGCW